MMGKKKSKFCDDRYELKWRRHNVDVVLSFKKQIKKH